MTKSITHLLSYLLIIFVYFTTNLRATQPEWRKGFNIYHYLEGNGAKIAIIGSGHTYNPNYPLNYFLMDNEGNENPDLVHDITQPVPDILNGQFDVVIMEHIPMHIHLDGIGQVYAMLKSGGQLITNNMCTFRTTEPDKFNQLNGVLINNGPNPGVKYEAKNGGTPVDFIMYSTEELLNLRGDLIIDAINGCKNLWEDSVIDVGFSQFKKIKPSENYNYITTFNPSQNEVYRIIKP